MPAPRARRRGFLREAIAWRCMTRRSPRHATRVGKPTGVLRPAAPNSPVETLEPGYGSGESPYETYCIPRQEPNMSLDLDALETSFDLVAPRGDELMDEFYDRLFAAAPAVRPLFPTDMKRQKTMLLGALVLLRKSLRNLDPIVPKLRDLGARHVAYGARPEHYPVVGTALIASMAAIAGAHWKPEYERAWSLAFDVVATVMLEGAEEAELGAVA
jgi:hemoglobin-like flavoprotein